MQKKDLRFANYARCFVDYHKFLECMPLFNIIKKKIKKTI